MTVPLPHAMCLMEWERSGVASRREHGSSEHQGRPATEWLKGGSRAERPGCPRGLVHRWGQYHVHLRRYPSPLTWQPKQWPVCSIHAGTKEGNYRPIRGVGPQDQATLVSYMGTTSITHQPSIRITTCPCNRLHLVYVFFRQYGAPFYAGARLGHCIMPLGH
jgi:hypothetical protein